MASSVDIRSTTTPQPSPTTSAHTWEPRPLILPTRTTSLEYGSRPSKRLSPGLELRLKRLEDRRHSAEEARRRRESIGRIPEEQLEELERLQRRQAIENHRRGRTWTGPPVRVMPSGGVMLDGGPVMSEGEASMLESDVSSIITISDRLVPSDTEDDDGLQDKQKYRLPDVGKTRLHLRTKEPLSPTARQVPRSPRRQTSTSTPNTPRTMQTPVNGYSPTTNGFPGANGSSENVNVSDSDFVSSGLSRANSIYTLGRASLQGQLAHLTSLKLPDANSLSKRVSSIPTSTEAAKALSDASDQIRMWISKASDVLNGLNAEDDVEWAAAGGREGIEDVDKAISRFQRLVDVYLVAIEELQTRADVATLSGDDLRTSVKQMESIITSWQKVKEVLKGVKEQVEIAMEWENLWNSVLGEIAQEMEGLNRLVFEMEEKRHQGAENLLSGRDSIDITELETIVEERPGKRATLGSNRFSLPSFPPTAPVPATGQHDRDDASLLALFARMQPLRASLDFLPMRLSVFHCRGNPIFPSACLDLEQRRDQLEAQWKKLEADAESLRRELGEDRWILVFRNAGRQALKMEESITRSYVKLKEAVDCSEHLTNAASYAKKVESYEAKKIHYGPAIERVLAIIDRGVLDRLTVNGEILRLQSDMKRRWTSLQAEMRDMDLVIEDLNVESHEKQLRDSVSTVMSSQQSIASSLVDTPGSSPASSVVGTSRKSSFQGSRTPTPLMNGKTRKSSGSRIPSSIPRRIPLTQSGEFTSAPPASPLATRAASKAAMRNDTPASNRARWNHSTIAESRDFLPLSAFEPSQYAKTPVAKHTNYLRSTRSTSTPIETPKAGPAGRSALAASRNVSTPIRTASRLATPPSAPAMSTPKSHPARTSSLPIPSTTNSARAPTSLASRRPPSAMKTPIQASNGRRSSLLASALVDGNEADTESPSHHKSRPPSALASGRRSSMLPLRSRGPSNGLPATVEGQENKPKWRP